MTTFNNSEAQVEARIEAMIEQGYDPIVAFECRHMVDDFELELDGLFAKVDEIGGKYQSDEERNAFRQQMDAIAADMPSEDEVFGDDEVMGVKLEGINPRSRFANMMRDAEAWYDGVDAYDMELHRVRDDINAAMAKRGLEGTDRPRLK